MPIAHGKKLSHRISFGMFGIPKTPKEEHLVSGHPIYISRNFNKSLDATTHGDTSVLIYISRNFNKSLDIALKLRGARIYISRNFNKSLDTQACCAGSGHLHK